MNATAIKNSDVLKAKNDHIERELHIVKTKTARNRFIASIACECAVRHKLSFPGMNHLLRLLDGQYKSPTYGDSGISTVFPMVVDSDNGQLWIDYEYVAFQDYETGEFHYIWVTDYHVSEEEKNYRQASNERKKKVSMPNYIRKEFSSRSNRQEWTRLSGAKIGKPSYIRNEYIQYLRDV